MTVIEQLREGLAEMSVAVREHPDGIIVPATSIEGFDVSILLVDGRYCVGFDRWDLDCFDASEKDIAAKLFTRCLSDRTRLVVGARGGRDVSWTLEELLDGQWASIARISNLASRFWLAKEVRHLQNHLYVLGPNNSFKPNPLRGSA
ncbi:hypothetical protein [Pseudoxanthomonas sp. PXM01]|uniref:hypothetical protein n=1 Tax=Pseudoxanthomonas sp. PXM01 TaxID=2769295 RepID=UPI00178347A6|nr:hypothetical protein [Pseudoxanthomonas sp. PXM01]MBD9470874.1 hypothetical protein [Pseudoxanthomonas sp. PXM01]